VWTPPGAQEESLYDGVEVWCGHVFGFFCGETLPPASMDYASPFYFRLTCCQHLSSNWFSEPRSNFGHAILRPSLLRGYSPGWLHVGPSVLQHCPGDTRHLVRQCHDRQHGWLSVEDAGQPGIRLGLATHDPRYDRTGVHDQKTS